MSIEEVERIEDAAAELTPPKFLVKVVVRTAKVVWRWLCGK